MPKASASSSSNAAVITAVAATSLAYAVVRYNVFAGVGWERLPLFIANKGISLASVLLLAVSYLANRGLPVSADARAARRQLARASGLSGFLLAMVHVVVSVVIFSGANYPTLFDGPRMNRAGFVCLVTGVMAMLLLLPPAFGSLAQVRQRMGAVRWKRAQQLGYLALAATAVHVLWIGVRNWPAVSRWPGALPPISLLSFVVCVVPVGAKMASMFRVGASRRLLSHRS